VFRTYKISAGVLLAIAATASIGACGSSGGGSGPASGPLTSTSTCANWNADRAGNDTTDMHNLVADDASTDQVPESTISDFITTQCAANPGVNLGGVLSAAALNALAPAVPGN
jgi:hypothetical protein